MTAVVRAPARLSSGLAVTAALVALGTSGAFSWIALVVGTVGLVLLVTGLVRGANAGITAGAFGLFGGAVVAGVQGAPPVAVLVSVTGVVLAWDVGGNAVSVGRQLGREARTRRIEVVHAGASALVGSVTAAVGYGIFQSATGGQPIAALVFSLLAAVLLVEALG